jgi:O-antigen/teichoic acid export membrane protein
MSVGLVQRAISFLLLPAYAHALAPSEYGTIALLITAFGGAQYLLSFGLEIAVFRGYFLHSETSADRHRYVNTLGLFLFAGPSLVAGVVTLLMTVLLQGRGVPTGLLGLELLTATIYVAATVMPLAVIRAQERLGAYIKINAAYAVAQVALKAALVLGLGMGVRGWVISDVCASIVMLCASIGVLRHPWTTDFDRRYIRAALILGLPMLPHFLSQWTLALADRLVLAALLNTSQVGLYSMGYQFGILLGIAVTETNRAVMPAYGRAVTSEAARTELSSTATMQILLAALLGAVTALVAPAMIRLFLPASYWPAASVVPIVALGYVFYGWYYVPMNAVSLIAGDTRFVAIPTIIAAAVNVGLNLWLVPMWGIFAAGLNTAISYGALLAMVGAYKRLRVPWTIPLEIGPLALSLALIAGSYALASVVLPSRGVSAVATRFLAMAVTSGVVVQLQAGSTRRRAARLDPLVLPGLASEGDR